MIAQVVPITRLRRPTSWWSYRIPSNLTCSAGSLVVISFRGRATLGIVWAVESDSDKATERIERVITQQPLIRAPHRSFIEWLAETGVCSLSSALYVWLPTALRSLPLTKPVQQLLQNWDTWEVDSTYAQEHAQTAVLLPSIRPDIMRALRQRGALDLFNDQSPTQELAEWIAIARGEQRMGMGRERSLFAPWLNLTQITLFEPEDISYYREQLPYISLVDASHQLAKLTSAQLNLRTKLPEEAAEALWPESTIPETSYTQEITITDLHRNPILNDNLIAAVHQAIAQKQQILILYNANDRIIDNEDGRVVLPGIQTLHKQLAARLGYSELPESIHFDTRSIFTHTHHDVGLTIALSLDPLLRQQTFADQLHGLADLGHLFSYQVPCLIQSHTLDHPLIHALRNNQFNTYCVSLIQEQKNLGLHPFAETICCTAPEDANDPSPQVLYEQLTQDNPLGWQIAHPTTTMIRKKEQAVIFLHAPQGTRLPASTRNILGSLARPWKIQRNPWFAI